MIIECVQCVPFRAEILQNALNSDVFRKKSRIKSEDQLLSYFML